MHFGVDHTDPQQYFDEREKPDYMLNLEDDVLYRQLRLRASLIERDSYYRPYIILEMDFFYIGKRKLSAPSPLFLKRNVFRFEEIRG